MKYTVLIADDEPNVIELIESMLDGDATRIVGRASDGVAALALTQEKHPEILITDIRMPGYNGLELIQQVRQISPATEIIVISGYREFEYLQTILKYGITEFILKPIDKQDLDRAVHNVIKHKKEISSQYQYMANIEMDLNSSYKHLREKLCLDIVNDRYKSNEAKDIPKDLFSFHDGKYRVLILKLDCMVDKIHDSDNNLLYTNTLQFRYRDAIVNMLLENCYDVLSAVHDSCVYFICNYDRNINDMVFLEGTGFNIHNLARALDEENIKYDFMHLSIAVGDDVDNLDEINKSVKGAKTALNRRIIPTQSSVIIAQQIEPDKNDVFTRSEKELVSMSVTSMSEEDLYSFIEEKVRFLRTSNRSELLYMLASSIVAFVKNVVAVNNLLDMDNEFFKIDIDERVDNCFTDGMIVSCLKTYLGEMFEEIRNLIAQRSSKALRTALTYIDNNYNQQITLQDVAEQVYYSPNYLGSIIKKETGHTFLEYLTNIRIRKAEELLRNSHYTIGKIATMVGYNDEKYFSQLFAKTTGIKPFEYRKFYS